MRELLRTTRRRRHARPGARRPVRRRLGSALAVAVLAALVAVPAVRTAVETGGTDRPTAATSPERDRDEPRSGDGDALETTVTRIVDGDTVVVADLDVRLRLIGIDTPEAVHPRRGVECFGHEATRHLEELVPPGTPVRVEWDVERHDRYDRPLGYLHRADDGLFVNLAMVRDGYASVATIPPNVTHADAFLAAQREARAARRGLWSACRED